MLHKYRHLAVPLGIQIACGVAYGLCFPPSCWSALAWVVLVPALIAMRRVATGEAAVLGGVLAFAGACVTVDWLFGAVVVYFEQSALVGAGLFAAIVLVMVVPPYAAFGAWYRASAERAGRALPLLAAAAWISGEYFRANFLGGNPWVLIGYSQARVVPVVAIADIGGVYAVGFVVILVNLTLAELCWRWREKGAWKTAVPALVLLALTLAWGSSRSEVKVAAERRDVPGIGVAVIQGNLDLGTQWSSDLYGRNLDTYLRASLKAIRESRPDLIVWPESSLTFFLEREPSYQQSIASVLRQGRTQLIAGGPHVVDDEETRFHNSALLVDSDGRVIDRYDKELLLPFAEYQPFRWLDLMNRDFGQVREFLPGPARPPLRAVGGPAGAMICNEALFPEIARARALAGATYLVTLTNDTWVGSEKFAQISFDMAIVRAVEQRRFLIRASTSGPSAIIAPDGSVLAQSAAFRPATTVGRIERRQDLTPYARVGDLVARACAVVTLLTLLLLRRRRTAP
jgi:apolipoprotein N-acyltransferase